MLESVEELRAQIRRGQTQPIESPFGPAKATPGPASSPTAPAPVDDSAPYRPSHRPSMALLVIFDDGEEEGETLRLRQARCLIGRAEGDVIIPHDPALSGRHAEVSRRVVDGAHRWLLRDLGSSNGTFVRVAKSPLQPAQELILGGRRYRFDLAATATAPAQEPAGMVAATQKWQVMRPAEGTGSATAALVEVSESGDGRRFPLAGPEQWVGRDARQSAIAIDDPMLSPRHARFSRDGSGRWHVENARSLNGVWLRVAEIAIERSCHFLCGEQRFQVRVF